MVFEQSAGTGGRLNRLRSLLDLFATVSVIIASVAVIRLALQTSSNQQIAPQSREAAEPVPPTAPQALEGAHLIGNREAKVAMIEFSDFECPYCAKFTREVWPAIKTEYIERGKVLAAFRHLPLPMHPFAKTAAVSADCAGQQGKFWEMRDLLFQKHGTVNKNTIGSLASTLGLNSAAFGRCLETNPEDRIRQDQGHATALRISGTPAFLIGLLQPDKTVAIAQVVRGAQPFARFKAILDGLLKEVP